MAFSELPELGCVARVCKCVARPCAGDAGLLLFFQRRSGGTLLFGRVWRVSGTWKNRVNYKWT